MFDNIVFQEELLKFMDRVYPAICEVCMFTPVAKPDLLLVSDLGSNKMHYKGLVIYTSIRNSEMVKVKTVIPRIFINIPAIIRDVQAIVRHNYNPVLVTELAKTVVLHELIHYVDLKKIQCSGVEFMDTGFGHEPYMLTVMDKVIPLINLNKMEMLSAKIDLAAGLLYEKKVDDQAWKDYYITNLLKMGELLEH